MTGRVASWAVGAAVSAVAHVGFGAALLAALQPQDVPDQPNPKSALTVSPEVVDRSAATPQEPDSDPLNEQDADSTTLGAGAVATSRAAPKAPQSDAAQAAPVPAAPVASAISAETALAQAAPADSSAAQAPDTITQMAQRPDVSSAAARPPQSANATATAPPASAAQTLTAPVDQAALRQPDTPTTSAVTAPQSQATTAQPSAETTAAAVPNASAVSGTAPEVSATVAADAPATPLAAAVALPAPTVGSRAPRAEAASAAAPAPAVAAAAPLPAATTQAQAAPVVTAALAALPQMEPQQAETSENQTPADALAVPSLRQPSSAPQTTTQGATPPDTALAAALQPETTSTKAVLAFPNAGTGAIDPASIAAFQSFTQPQTDGADPVRDNLQAALSLPCSRMQVSFDPVTTQLSVQGHVPRPDQRAPVIAALQAQMGEDIEVTDNLLVLPAPQCGALSGIASVGLPQSTDQITNPLIVGQDTHARSFRYIKDDPLVLNLTAPDYPAYVYVDYFDADGNVIHLSPNARAPLAATTPKEQLQIGARRADEPGLMVIIGPPYGQEIAVAFAASVPLYEEERPLVEPAEAYLSWLREQVTKARAAHPDFKGEWVYFFVQTAAE